MQGSPALHTFARIGPQPSRCSSRHSVYPRWLLNQLFYISSSLASPFLVPTSSISEAMAVNLQSVADLLSASLDPRQNKQGECSCAFSSPAFANFWCSRAVVKGRRVQTRLLPRPPTDRSERYLPPPDEISEFPILQKLRAAKLDGM